MVSLLILLTLPGVAQDVPGVNQTEIYPYYGASLADPQWDDVTQRGIQVQWDDITGSAGSAPGTQGISNPVQGVDPHCWEHWMDGQYGLHPGDTSEMLVGWFYPEVPLPDDAKILGIEVELQWIDSSMTTGAEPVERRATLYYNDTMVGDDRGQGRLVPRNPHIWTFGGQSDLWGLGIYNPRGHHINSGLVGFGFAADQGPGGVSTLDINYYKMTVTWR